MLAKDLAELLEKLLDEQAQGGTSDGARLRAALAEQAMRASAAGTSGTEAGDVPARLADYLDGVLDPDEQARFEALLAGEPAELFEMEAARSFVDEMAARRQQPPADLLQTALSNVARDDLPESRVVPMRLRSASGKHAEYSEPRFQPSDSFLLLAAAGASDSKAILCHSQSGLWTLEVFVGQSPRDRELERGYLLLSVQADHRATYEGRMARIFVKDGDSERILAEDIVHDGELYAEISLKGLQLRTRDAVNVIFGARPDAT